MILVVNAGSSSLKFKVFDAPTLRERASGIVERIGLKGSFLAIAAGKKEARKEFPKGVDDHRAALERVFEALRENGIDTAAIRAVGHRVVHGGEEFVSPIVIDDNTAKRLETYDKLAPLHNPPNRQG